jgi:hypothetical protein
MRLFRRFVDLYGSSIISSNQPEHCLIKGWFRTWETCLTDKSFNLSITHYPLPNIKITL